MEQRTDMDTYPRQDLAFMNHSLFSQPPFAQLVSRYDLSCLVSVRDDAQVTGIRFLFTKKFRLVRVVGGSGRVQHCVQRHRMSRPPVYFASVPVGVRAAIQKWRWASAQNMNLHTSWNRLTSVMCAVVLVY